MEQARTIRVPMILLNRVTSREFSNQKALAQLQLTSLGHSDAVKGW